MIIIGLTGSVGMGKSTTASMFERMGIPVHDSDAVIRQTLTTQNPALEKVAAAFPDAWNARKKQLNRMKLGEIVFKDAEKRKKLEAILHPVVWDSQDAFLAQARRAGAKYAVLDIPLLFETGAEKRVNVTICCMAPAFVQAFRVLARPNFTAEKYLAVRSQQMSDVEKQKRADFVLYTGLGHADTLRRLKIILQEIEKRK